MPPELAALIEAMLATTLPILEMMLTKTIEQHTMITTKNNAFAGANRDPKATASVLPTNPL